jgi:hypothetical protein
MAASLDEGWWVPCPIALARRHAQEAARHAPTLPLVAAQRHHLLSQTSPHPKANGLGELPQQSLSKAREALLATRTLGERAFRRLPGSVLCA